MFYCNAPSLGSAWASIVNMLTDLQILGCELNKHAFGGRTPPRPAGGAIALPQPPNVIRGGRKGERIGNREGEREGTEGRKGVRIGDEKGDGWNEKRARVGNGGMARLGYLSRGARVPALHYCSPPVYTGRTVAGRCCYFGHAVISYNVPYWS